ncbi:hypothetical protein WJX73_005372 [Symbiochloris irregularis]|uniref:Rhodanese domain-containing protein n=1 Tax=Symbiochloris irregularis TaxID=706552 RepID=A0AAW1NU79_9CHLO
MPSITNVGGSLTSAAVLTLLAWGVRFFRATAQRKRLQAEQAASKPPPLGRFFCLLSPVSLYFLVRHRPIPFAIFDVRSSAEAEQQPLPEELTDVLRIPVPELQEWLQGCTVISSRDKHKPRKQDLLCLVGKDATQMRDERTLYGCIPGSVHIPLEQLAHALQSQPDAFEAAYGLPQPLRAYGWLIMTSRRQRRAAWGAQLAHDAGFRQTLVLHQGVCGWRLHPGIQAYEAYSDGEPPPDPEPFRAEALDEAGGMEELVRLGMLPRDALAGRSSR